MKKLPPNETTYLLGYFNEHDFWCSFETKDRKQADRVLEKHKNEEPNKDWVIVFRYTSYSICSGQE